MKSGNWIVKMRCSVEKEVVLANCTEEEARTNPWDYAVEERELGQNDWEVTSVEPNE